MARRSVFDSGSRPDEPPLVIMRPLLEIPKARLQAALRERGVSWIEDPSNQVPAFERTRWRTARPRLEELGLRAGALSLSARRLQRARTALDFAADAFCASGSLECHPCGFVRIAAPALVEAPEEIATRVLMRAVAAVGGSGGPISLAKIEAVMARLRTRAMQGKWTLARATVCGDGRLVLVTREQGRTLPPGVSIAPGQRLLWDGRFWIEAGAQLEASLDVAALGEEGVRELRRSGVETQGLPSSALHTLPALWQQGMLTGTPLLKYHPAEAARQVSMTFAGVRKFRTLRADGLLGA
jgi:tRNA(Ile)-lysidine synthase